MLPINQESVKKVLKKVLVTDTDKETIHYIEGGFMTTRKTLCGEHLNPISTIHIRKLGVTCKKCLKIAGKTTSKRPKSRKSLTPVNIVRMINGWHSKTTTEWAKEFKVTYQTVIKTITIIHKEDPQLCPPKQHKGKATRGDIAKQGIFLYKKMMAK